MKIKILNYKFVFQLITLLVLSQIMNINAQEILAIRGPVIESGKIYNANSNLKWAMLLSLQVKNNTDKFIEIALDDIEASISNEKIKLFSKNTMKSSSLGVLKGISEKLAIAKGDVYVFLVYTLLSNRSQAKDVILKHKGKTIPFALQEPLTYINNIGYSIPYLVSKKNPIKGQTTLPYYLPQSFDSNNKINVAKIRFDELIIENAFSFYIGSMHRLIVILEIRPSVPKQGLKQYQIMSLPKLLYQNRNIVASNKKMELGENLYLRLMNCNSIMQFDKYIQSDWRVLIYEIPKEIEVNEIKLKTSRCQVRIQYTNDKLVNFLPRGCITRK